MTLPTPTPSRPGGATLAAFAGWDRFSAGRADQAWYFGELLRVCEARLPASQNLPEFRRVVGDLFPAEGLPVARPQIQ